MEDKRITIFAGHYGSGKTNLAVNYAMYLKRKHPVAIADLDIVNPYFRTKDSEEALSSSGIRFISSEYSNTNLEAPALPSEAVSLFDDKSVYGVIDLGGDDRGAYAIGRYAGYIEKELYKNILLVVNCYRPLTKTADAVCKIRDEIENAAHISFTGIVNNSNLGAGTTASDVLASGRYIIEASQKTKLPIVMTSVMEGLFTELYKKVPDLFCLKIITKNEWRI